MFKAVMKHLSMENASIGAALARMVQSTTSHPCLRDDLLQEAVVHAWLIEERRPGQTRSWYLQSCKFHLRHYLESGRSVDSQKRRAGQLLPDDMDGHDELLDQIDSGDSVFDCVSARESVIAGHASAHRIDAIIVRRSFEKSCGPGYLRRERKGDAGYRK